MAPTGSNDRKAVTVGHFETHMWNLTPSDVLSRGYVLVRRSRHLELLLCLTFILDRAVLRLGL